MIRTNHAGTAPKRRIAVIAMPRPQRARLGSIGDGSPAGYGAPAAWTTITDEGPESSSNFISSVLNRQTYAAINTPGTLNYTPAPSGPAPNVAPWNSWLQPNCPPAEDSGGAGIIANASNGEIFWGALGLISAAAAALYLANHHKKGSR